MKKFFFPVQYMTQKYLYAEAETFDEAYDIVNKFISNTAKHGSVIGANDTNPSGDFHILRCDKNKNAVNFSYSYEKLKKMNDDDEDLFYQKYPNNKRIILTKDKVEKNDLSLMYIWGEKEHIPEY